MKIYERPFLIKLRTLCLDCACGKLVGGGK